MIDRDELRLSELIHEMRNQLSVAQANLEAFIDGKLSPTAERLESVVQTLRHLEQLIKDLHTLHPGAAGEERALATALAEINVCDLLQHEYASIEGVATEKGVKLSIFRCAHPNAACQHFYGDPTRIGEIVSNVLLNAVRYTPPGGTIFVDCARRADELQVTIADEGPGITAGEAKRIFEPGYRGAAATREGSGLGLAIVKELVEAQGGSIRLDPDTPRGARFVVRLPGRLPYAD